MGATRYRLRGHLETASLLHLGSGETMARQGLVVERRTAAGGVEEVPAEVAGFVVDHQERPYVPGTSLKGVLRDWAQQSGMAPALLARVFGSEERGAGACFLDSSRDSPRDSLADAPPQDGAPPVVRPPYWCPRRGTGVVSRVALDRRRGTASHQRLFHQEVVPAGVSFAVCVVTEGLGLDEVALLLAAFASFGAASTPALGAHTADGWGRMVWRPGVVERLGEAEVRAWLAGGAPDVAGQAFAPLAQDALEELHGRARALTKTKNPAHPPGPGAGEPALGVELELSFDGPFLVNDQDPARTGPGVDTPDAAPRRDPGGRVLLPASSLRGALRSRAERILRTLGGDGAACAMDGPRPSCAAVETLSEVQGLCPACRVFGAPGWRTPLAVDDFVSAEPVAEEDLLSQHFVAIDRFTGGASQKRKFDLRAAASPVLAGHLRLDLAALDRAAVGGWGIALVVLVLRDLAWGDLPLGAGSAKGYGVATGRVVGLRLPRVWDEVPERLGQLLAPAAVHLGSPPVWPQSTGTPLGHALATWVDELEEVARRAGDAWPALQDSGRGRRGRA